MIFLKTKTISKTVDLTEIKYFHFMYSGGVLYDRFCVIKNKKNINNIATMSCTILYIFIKIYVDLINFYDVMVNNFVRKIRI